MLASTAWFARGVNGVSQEESVEISKAVTYGLLGRRRWEDDLSPVVPQYLRY
jgi:hypothetical protein